MAPTLTMPFSAGPVETELIAIVPEFAMDVSACALATTATVSEEGASVGAVYRIGKPFGHAVTLVAVTAG